MTQTAPASSKIALSLREDMVLRRIHTLGDGISCCDLMMDMLGANQFPDHVHGALVRLAALDLIEMAPFSGNRTIYGYALRRLSITQQGYHYIRFTEPKAGRVPVAAITLILAGFLLVAGWLVTRVEFMNIVALLMIFAGVFWIVLRSLIPKDGMLGDL